MAITAVKQTVSSVGRWLQRGARLRGAVRCFSPAVGSACSPRSGRPRPARMVLDLLRTSPGNCVPSPTTKTVALTAVITPCRVIHRRCSLYVKSVAPFLHRARCACGISQADMRLVDRKLFSSGLLCQSARRGSRRFPFGWLQHLQFARCS